MAFKALFFSNGLYLLYLLLAVDHAAAHYLLLSPSPRWAGTMEPSNRYLLARAHCPIPGWRRQSPAPSHQHRPHGQSPLDPEKMRIPNNPPSTSPGSAGGEGQAWLSPPGIPSSSLPKSQPRQGRENLQINGIPSSQGNISGLIRLVVGSDGTFNRMEPTQALPCLRRGSVPFQPFQLSQQSLLNDGAS